MSRAQCTRAWQAEAIEDGRLGGAERLAFERHVAGCQVCAEEVAALNALREAMQHAPALTSTPLEQQRMRLSLLHRADAAMVGTRARAPNRTLLGWGAAVAACAALIGTGYLLVARSPRGASDANVASAALPRFEIAGEAGAQWVDRSGGSIGRTVLHDGTVAVHVHHLTTGQRFLLGLPDGEIEVHGTRFTVAVAEGRTKRVEVSEGLVSLRLQGQSERLLHAGNHWERPTAIAANELASRATRSEPAVGALSVPHEPPASTVRAHTEPAPSEELGSTSVVQRAIAQQPAITRVSPSKKPSARRSGDAGLDPATARSGSAALGGSAAQREEKVAPSATDSVAHASSLASQRFAEAVAAFHAHAYADALTRLAQFARDFPADPRNEDVAFLRAVASAQMGDKVQAAALAREYLQRFPHGLRRNEAQRILGAGPRP